MLQVHFGKIWQIGFGKNIVSKRIKRTKITLICGLFFVFKEHFKQRFKQDLSKIIVVIIQKWYNINGDDNDV